MVLRYKLMSNTAYQDEVIILKVKDWQTADKSVKQFRKKGFTMDIILKLSEELGIRKSQAEAAVKLIDEGNTIPFIARYRKEVTGSLNDEVLRNLYERLTYLRNLEERKETVLNSIEEQGKLTDELRRRSLRLRRWLLWRIYTALTNQSAEQGLRLQRRGDSNPLPM